MKKHKGKGNDEIEARVSIFEKKIAEFESQVNLLAVEIKRLHEAIFLEKVRSFVISAVIDIGFEEPFERIALKRTDQKLRAILSGMAEPHGVELDNFFDALEMAYLKDSDEYIRHLH